MFEHGFRNSDGGRTAKPGPGKALLVLELLVIVAGPIALAGLSAQLLRLSTIFLVAGYCFWRLKANGVEMIYLAINWEGCTRALPGLLARWLLGTGAIALIVLLVSPDRLFCIPRADPLAMAAIVVFYGLVSVLPQEIAFRAYVSWRMDTFNVPYVSALLVSATLFGWVHIIFGTWLSVFLAAVAGLSFYRTYRKYRSLAAVWLEHTLIGVSVFAIGLDNYFYLGPTSPALAITCGVAT
ncbi:CAAX amino terminal protease self- immunity [Labrenzia sp. THAF82]|uniref:CPBP family intramembrane glutamic endopeptidase n=1 Tax=Labrenzia sp. THAF82 TaxID=2587861 RepID=UPI001267D69A|nr:CPBP family intramembrane glutamic endopeptidase [Labrenzia sp. THAF82]QFT32627.1 CAAX amino terminal protease self- immunity [Labrenzia sp. THAF82]